MGVRAVACLCSDVACRVALKDTALRIRFPRRAECAGDGGAGEGMGVRAVAVLCSDVACRVAINDIASRLKIPHPKLIPHCA